MKRRSDNRSGAVGLKRETAKSVPVELGVAGELGAAGALDEALPLVSELLWALVLR